MSHVKHAPERNRFELDLPGGPATLSYERDDGRLVLLHTGVPETHEGRGHGSALVQAAVDHARAEGLEVVPLCSFARAYLEGKGEG